MLDSRTAINKSTLLSMPGAQMVVKGLEDMENGSASVEYYLARIASPVLVKAGLLNKVSTSIDDEINLYQLLNTKDEPNAYGKYNSLMRLLVSFETCMKRHLAELEARS